MHCARVDNKQFNIDYLHWTDVFNKIFMQSVKKIKKRDRRWMTRRKKNAFDTFISGILSVYWGHMVCTWQKCHNMCNMIHLNMLSFFPTKRTDHLHFALSCCCFLKSSTKFARNRKKNEKKKRRRQNDEDKKKHTNIFSFFL